MSYALFADLPSDTLLSLNTSNQGPIGVQVAPAAVTYVVFLPGSSAAVATLNTATLQRVINGVGLAGGGVIQLPRGTWYLYPVGIVYSNIHVRGAGRGATTLVMGPSPLVSLDEMFRFGIAAGSSTPVAIRNCSIGELTGNGNRAQQVNGNDPAGSNAAIVGVATVVGMDVFDMEIFGCDGYGVSFFGTDFAGRSDWRVTNVETHHNNYDGLDIKGGTTNKPSRIYIADCYSHDNVPFGLTIPGRDSVGFDLRGDEITLVRCTAERNATSGIRCRDGADGCYSATLVGCTSNGNTGAGFQMDGVATGVYTVFGGSAKANTQWGCRCEGGTTVLNGVTLSGQLRGLTNFTTGCTIIANDCFVQDNTDYGVRVDPAASVLELTGGFVRRNGLEGVRVACGQVEMTNVDVLDNSQAAGSHAGILLLATATFWRILNCRSTNKEGATQNYGVEFQAALPAGYLQAYILGNANAPTSGTMPTGTLYFGTGGISVPTLAP